MESIGVKIRTHREEKGYSLDQVARDTHITRRFLEAIEEENFSVLPGESYVIGFLRSYAEYLGLDAVEMVSLYQNMKLQEQPAPMTELLERKRISTPALIVLIVLAAGLLGGGAYYLYTSSQEPEFVQEGNKIVSVPQNTAVNLASNTTEEREYSVGEAVKLDLGGQVYELKLGYKNSIVELDIAGTPVAMPRSETVQLDINQDGNKDVAILIKGVNSSAQPVRVSLALTRISGSSTPAASNLPSGEGIVNPNLPANAQVAAVSGAVDTLVAVVPAGQTNQSNRIKPVQTIPEYTDLTRIAVSVRFDGLSSIRYESDSGNRVERLAQAGEPVDIVGQNSVRLWLGNAGRASIRIGSRVFRAGQDGEVVALQFSWSSQPGQPRQLVMSPLY